MSIPWEPISEALGEFYKEIEYEDCCFQLDESYLKEAFLYTEKKWDENLEKLEKIGDIKVVMLSEAPLFGKDKSYIYNENTKPTSFFYYNNLSAFVGKDLPDPTDEFIDKKQVMLDAFATNGFLILDIFPFALKPKGIPKGDSSGTHITYPTLKKDYIKLFQKITDSYFEPKLKQCIKLGKKTPVFVYRYNRLCESTKSDVRKIIVEMIPEEERKSFELLSIHGPNMSMDEAKLKNIYSDIRSK